MARRWEGEEGEAPAGDSRTGSGAGECQLQRLCGPWAPLHLPFPLTLAADACSSPSHTTPCPQTVACVAGLPSYCIVRAGRCRNCAAVCGPFSPPAPVRGAAEGLGRAQWLFPPKPQRCTASGPVGACGSPGAAAIPAGSACPCRLWSPRPPRPPRSLAPPADRCGRAARERNGVVHWAPARARRTIHR